MRGVAFALLILVCFNVCAETPEQEEMEVGFMLADEVIEGEVRSVAMTADNPWGNYAISMSTSGGLRTIFFLDPLRNPPPLMVGDRRRFLVRSDVAADGTAATSILLFPVVGILGVEQPMQEIAQERERAFSTARTFIRSGNGCSSGLLKIIKRLDGADVQFGLDRLFELRQISKNDFICLVEQIRSKGALSHRSFKNPASGGFEDVYHHSYKTRGELIANLLPALMGAKIVSLKSPFDDLERKKLIGAWGYWGAQREWPIKR